MIISSNTKQSFSSTSGIKVTQNNTSTNQSKNTEATSLNINSSTLQTLNLLSSLKLVSALFLSVISESSVYPANWIEKSLSWFRITGDIPATLL